MLPKSLRLLKKADFEAVFRVRKAIFGSEIGLLYRPTMLPSIRIGFSFKQKSFPRAASRHFLKRKGSAIMRELILELPKGMDIVILFHKPFSRPVEYQFLKTELLRLIKRLNREQK